LTRRGRSEAPRDKGIRTAHAVQTLKTEVNGRRATRTMVAAKQPNAEKSRISVRDLGIGRGILKLADPKL